MRCAEGVVVALSPAREAGQPAAHAQGANAVAPASQNLVRIGLMADVPDQPIVRRGERMVERDGEFYDAETCAEMAAGDGDRVDGFGAQLGGKLFQLIAREIARVGGRIDFVEKRRVDHGLDYSHIRFRYD